MAVLRRPKSETSTEQELAWARETIERQNEEIARLRSPAGAKQSILNSFYATPEQKLAVLTDEERADLKRRAEEYDGYSTCSMLVLEVGPLLTGEDARHGSR